MSDMLIFISYNTDKHKFDSLWIWISFKNDVMYDVDYMIKHCIYL